MENRNHSLFSTAMSEKLHGNSYVRGLASQQVRSGPGSIESHQRLLFLQIRRMPMYKPLVTIKSLEVAALWAQLASVSVYEDSLGLLIALRRYLCLGA